MHDTPNTRPLSPLGPNLASDSLRAFIAFIQGMFTNGDIGYRWMADRSQTDIIIAEGPVDGAITDTDLPKLPAILLRESGSQCLAAPASMLVPTTMFSQSKSARVPEEFSVLIHVIDVDKDACKDLTDMLFKATAIMCPIISRKTGVAFTAPPSKRYMGLVSSERKQLTMGEVTLRCRVVSYIAVSQSAGSPVDALLRDGTIALDAAFQPGQGYTPTALSQLSLTESSTQTDGDGAPAQPMWVSGLQGRE